MSDASPSGDRTSSRRGVQPRPGRVRFRPPTLTLSEEVKEVLLLAFAPEGAEAPRRPGSIWTLSGRLGLREAIADHRQAGRIKGSLPRDLEQRLVTLRRRVLALGMLHEEVARKITALAQHLDCPLIFLKGFALEAAGVYPRGARAYADVDLLAPSRRARDLVQALEFEGFESLPQPANEQHLSALRTPHGRLVDVHFRLRGVRCASSGWATADELIAEGLVEKLAGFDGALIPRRSILAGHILAHGIEQHGFRPDSYPPLRMVDDLARLLPDRTGWERFEQLGFHRIERSVTVGELKAVRELAALLRQGKLPQAKTNPEAELLLRHVIAGSEQPRYARSLRRRHLMDRMRTAWRQGELIAYLGRKLSGRKSG